MSETRFPSVAVLLLPLAAVLAPGCETHDIGKLCPELLGDDDPALTGGTRVETAEVVAHDVRFSCDELICVSTDGRSGYCSKKCREHAGCPAGFECRVVQPLGGMADEKYCVWKPCERRADCGPKEEFCCVEADNIPVGEQLRLCDFSERYKRCP